MSGKIVIKLVIVAAAATLAMLASTPTNLAAQSREYPWCAYYDFNATNCGFDTREQCRAAISGIGGFCQTNPRHIAPAPSRGGRNDDRKSDRRN